MGRRQVEALNKKQDIVDDGNIEISFTRNDVPNICPAPPSRNV